MDSTVLDLKALRKLLDEGPRPLFATVSGAHLYGFPSPDSDVDLRGAFVAPLHDVLGLRSYEETRTVSDLYDGVEVDWVAHDVLKFCRLMTRRNGYVLEQLFSPLVVEGGTWLDELRRIGQGCAVRHLLHHYRGFLHNQRRLLAKEPTVKALLYAYRVALTGIHVLGTGRIEAHLPTLLAEYHEPDVAELVERKRTGTEKAGLEDVEIVRHRGRLDALDRLLEEAFESSSLPDKPSAATLGALHDFVVRARLELGGG